ncbi:BgTH12-05127 [Blumeria graminis f. sp. triticale]|uniref:BgtAc-31234 n=3 Tax=Blumeria graminis TaxID=34373 RepID=A0A9X9QD52_BLUGR|nr:hypothetical protein BGT96224_Ac31234 [Blumeria graminis f. sp. tritici 96224]CAD6502536.1 BgTH12-05127 [Blumeria graminis f. sp. triticale]VDB87920.1 BgtAc-31234 [Blumeria graminis f. sp. tritici]
MYCIYLFTYALSIDQGLKTTFYLLNNLPILKENYYVRYHEISGSREAFFSQNLLHINYKAIPIQNPSFSLGKICEAEWTTLGDVYKYLDQQIGRIDDLGRNIPLPVSLTASRKCLSLLQKLTSKKIPISMSRIMDGRVEPCTPRIILSLVRQQLVRVKGKYDSYSHSYKAPITVNGNVQLPLETVLDSPYNITPIYFEKKFLYLVFIFGDIKIMSLDDEEPDTFQISPYLGYVTWSSHIDIYGFFLAIEFGRYEVILKVPYRVDLSHASLG